jgi:hypothetical protein
MSRLVNSGFEDFRRLGQKIIVQERTGGSAVMSQNTE